MNNNERKKLIEFFVMLIVFGVLGSVIITLLTLMIMSAMR